MTKANYQKELGKIIKALEPYRPEKIILFGSAARNQFQPGSDLDLLIIKKTKKPFLERNFEARSLIDSQFPFDVFVLTPEEVARGKQNWQSFVIDILEEGKVIYG